jgi:hypothetical protein
MKKHLKLFWDLFVKINCCSNRIGATFKPTNKTKKKLWGSEREPPLCVKGGKGLILPRGTKVRLAGKGVRV